MRIKCHSDFPFNLTKRNKILTNNKTNDNYEKEFLFPAHGRAGVRFEPERHLM